MYEEIRTLIHVLYRILLFFMSRLIFFTCINYCWSLTKAFHCRNFPWHLYLWQLNLKLEVASEGDVSATVWRMAIRFRIHIWGKLCVKSLHGRPTETKYWPKCIREKYRNVQWVILWGHLRVLVFITVRCVSYAWNIFFVCVKIRPSHTN